MFCVDMGRLSLARERGGLGSAPGSKSFREVGECNSKPITVILSPSPREERNAGPACSPNPEAMENHEAQSTIGEHQPGGRTIKPTAWPLMRKEDASPLAKIFPRFAASPRLLWCKR